MEQLAPSFAVVQFVLGGNYLRDLRTYGVPIWTPQYVELLIREGRVQERGMLERTAKVKAVKLG